VRACVQSPVLQKEKAKRKEQRKKEKERKERQQERKKKKIQLIELWKSAQSSAQGAASGSCFGLGLELSSKRILNCTWEAEAGGS
jgi:hypothetical protein